ncbi:MAG: S41 family peptidase [Solirubrobacteraceae bacterium]|jgi:carboxyl-terminal processing protease
MRARRPGSRIWLPRLLAGLVVLLLGVWLGGHPNLLPAPVRSTFVASNGNDRIIDQVLGLVSRDYYRKVPRSSLVNQGLAAAVASLNDPYSHYYDPADYHAFQNQDNPHVAGIGIDIVPAPRGLLVRDVFGGSPASRAGLQGGDLILAVGSTTLAKRPERVSESLIRGRPGTTVTLTIARGRHTRVITVRRANIVVPVAAGRIISYHGVKLGYIELTSFTQGSGDEVRQQVHNVLGQGARGLILDLRQNGGGLLEEAVNVASIFIPNGTIVSTAGRAQPRQVYMAKGDAIATKQPLVVLVDSGTASSSEIVSAALQQRGRAKIVGTHTYGKGVFQEIQPLPNGGALDFTVGEFFTPNGENLGGGGVRRGPGIKPDVYAYTKPSAKTDTALTVAERTVAAGLQ